MHDFISVPEDGNFVCTVDIPEGTCVSDARDMCYKLKDELIQKGISSDRFTIVPVGMGSPVNDLKIIPDHRSVALWVEYPAAHYFKCSVCHYTVPYKKAVPFQNSCSYKFCPSCGRVIVGWANKNDM